MISKSKTQTQKLAIRLAKKILRANRPERSRRATIIALSGDLGSGKTAFTQGFAKALKIKNAITSPTFIIFRRHKISEPRNSSFIIHHSNLYHFDLYRIKNLKELSTLKFKEIINNPENIVLIEWPKKVKKLLPKNTLFINFRHGKNKNERLIFIKNNL